MKMYLLAHAWGGHIGIEFYIALDDDRPLTGGSDNQGIIPTSALQKMDSILDDGNLNTGNVIGNGACTSVTGELFIKMNI